MTVTSNLTLLPIVNADLTKRNNSIFSDSHLTASYGNSIVCGDHICGPGEHARMLEMMNEAQLIGGKKTSIIENQTTINLNQTTTNLNQTTISTNQTSIPTTKVTPPTSGVSWGSTLKLSNANLRLIIPLEKGLYDGKDVYYITTEASDANFAFNLTNVTTFPVTYSPSLKKTPDSALAQIYLFKNGIKGAGLLGFQSDVLDSIPGDQNYSPLWKVNLVEWRDPSTSTILGSDDEIIKEFNQSKLTITPTTIVVNSPIIQWSGNKEGTIPPGHMKLVDNVTLNETGPYGNAQVLKIDTDGMNVAFVAHRGFAPDGSTIYYIATDSSQKDPSDALGIIFVNKTQATLSTSSSADLYQFSNGIQGSGPLGFQSGVASTKQGDQYYSPMWRIQVISWKDPMMATVLENTHDITSKSDQITITEGGFVVNCPFFSVDTVFSHMK